MDDIDSNNDPEIIKPNILETFSSKPKLLDTGLNEEEDDLDSFNFINGASPESLQNLLDRKFSNDIWLIDSLIPADGITILSALPGSFKTWLLLDIARAVASGGELFKQFQAKRTGVLIIDEENSERMLQSRLNKLGTPPDLPIMFLSDTNFKLDVDTVQEIINYCDLNDIGLVTFDSLIRIHNGNENDSKDMAVVFSHIRDIARAGLTVLLTHHNRKPSRDPANSAHEMRGSSDILAALDCHLALSREGHSLKLKQTKIRVAEEIAPLNLQVVSNDDSLELVYTGSEEAPPNKADAARVVILAALQANEEGLNKRQLLDALFRTDAKINGRTLANLLTRMLGDDEISSRPGQRNSTMYFLSDHSNDSSDAKVHAL